MDRGRADARADARLRPARGLAPAGFAARARRGAVFALAAVAMSLATLAAAAPSVTRAQRLDPAQSRFGFELRTRWGQRIDGNFPHFEGEVVDLPDGRRQVHVRLTTAQVEVAGSPRYTRFARSDRFLDAQRHPWVEFHSEPYSRELLKTGGPLPGVLRMRGISRHQVFLLEPGTCERPARDCDVVGQGRVDRGEYGLHSWRWALTDEVRFHLRVRLQTGGLRDNALHERMPHDSRLHDNTPHDGTPRQTVPHERAPHDSAPQERTP